MKKIISVLLMTIIVVNIHFADNLDHIDYTVVNPDEPQSEAIELRQKKLIKTLIEEYQKNENDENMQNWISRYDSILFEDMYIYEWKYPKENYDSMSRFEKTVYFEVDYAIYPIEEKIKRDYLKKELYSSKRWFWYYTDVFKNEPDAIYPQTEKFYKTLEEIINWQWDYYQETGKYLIFFPEEVFRISDYNDVDVEELEVKINQLEEGAKTASNTEKEETSIEKEEASKSEVAVKADDKKVNDKKVDDKKTESKQADSANNSIVTTLLILCVVIILILSYFLIKNKRNE